MVTILARPHCHERGRDLAIEIVEEVGSNAAISIISTAAGAALGAKIGGAIGTAIFPGAGTVIGIIAGMLISDVTGKLYERYIENDAVDLISSIFGLFGI